MASRDLALTSLPLEILRLIVDNLPRFDLFSVRLLSKTFAAVAAERLFHSIPLWMHSSSLQAITHLSHNSTLRKYVRHIVFSTLRVRDHHDEKVYLSGVKKHLEMQTDSMSLGALKYGQHKKAYHAALEDQEYLMKGALDVKILTRAFREFSNLKELTIDDRNCHIGCRQLIRDFGSFISADLLTCNGMDTLPSLIQALSEAGVQLSHLTIGWENVFDTIETPNLLEMGDPRPSYIKGLCSNAMTTAIFDLETIAPVRRLLSEVQTLEISDLSVKDDKSDLLRMARAIKRLIQFTFKLESVAIKEICSEIFMTDMQPLSVEDLFCVRTGPQSLRIVTLSNLTITNHLVLVSFIKRQAAFLKVVYFNFFSLEDVKWSEVLDQLRDFDFPNLKVFNFLECSDRESTALGHSDICEIWASQYLLYQTDRNPWVVPYD